MGAKKFLEKIGIIEDVEPEVKLNKSDIPQNAASIPIQTVYTPTDQNSSDVILKIRQRIETALSSMKKSTNGVDFLSIIQSIEGTKSMISDEASRFKTAILFAKTMNSSLNKDDIISSADYYIQSLDTIKDNFILSTDRANKNIEDQKAELASTQLRISQLKSELSELTLKTSSLESEIEESTNKTTEALSAFEVIHNELKEKMLKDKEKLIQYI